MLDDFEKTYPIKYITDLQEFINESRYEDFYENDEQETVSVSTIHKSKGREFDNVYIILKDIYCNSDEEQRQIYVGITRAKRNLYIHTNTDIFKKYKAIVSNYVYDAANYDEPEEIIVETTHRDVVLDFFKSRKDIIYSLHSGSLLTADGAFLSTDIDGRNIRVAKFSKSFIDKIQGLVKKDYVFKKAIVRFIVEWKSKDDNDETPILLTSITFAGNAGA